MSLPNPSKSMIPTVRPQQAIDRKYFGPVYHGSPHMETILMEGFKIIEPISARITSIQTQLVGCRNGYDLFPYHDGDPPPIHHLGFGIYFTTSRSIAKNYNGGTLRNVPTFWLATKKILTINFAANSTMMKWWKSMGYNPPRDLCKTKDFQAWKAATSNLTKTLKKQYDAVWFKGKGIHRNLDGDQICVFRPGIIRIQGSAAKNRLELGAKVVHNQTPSPNREFVESTKYPGWKCEIASEQEQYTAAIPPPNVKGTIRRITPIPEHFTLREPGATHWIEVKWNNGPIGHAYTNLNLKPAKSR